MVRVQDRKLFSFFQIFVQFSAPQNINLFICNDLQNVNFYQQNIKKVKSACKLMQADFHLYNYLRGSLVERVDNQT